MQPEGGLAFVALAGDDSDLERGGGDLLLAVGEDLRRNRILRVSLLRENAR
jgi:hypothetical protein